MVSPDSSPSPPAYRPRWGMGERRIERLIGVYRANGGLLGELKYVAARATGRGHCSLCDITHRGLRPKTEWEEFRRSLPTPLELVHLNDRTEPVRAASAVGSPCVLGQLGQDLVVLLGPEDLEACAGDVATFANRLRQAAVDHGLSLSDSSPRGGSVAGPVGLGEPEAGHQ
jgi:hypothetical protein